MIGIVRPRVGFWVIALVPVIAAVAIQRAPRIATPSLRPFVLPHPRPHGCAPFVDEIVQRADWSLHVVNSGATGIAQLGRFVIHADGGVEWTLHDEPDRRLTLMGGELARIRALNQLDCARTQPIDFDQRSFEIYRGDEGSDGAELDATSEMSNELEAILVAAIDRYDEASVALTGPLRIELDARSVWTSARWSRRAARFHVTLTPDGRLIVTQGRRVISEALLDRRELVDLVDAIVTLPAAAISEDDVARGHADIGTRTVPLRIEEYAPAGLELLTTTLDDATYNR